MGKDLIFEVLKRDKVICQLYYDSQGNRKLDFLSEERTDRLFCPKGTSRSDITEYYEERVFPSRRVNREDLLKDLGLSLYDPYLICRETHGVLYDDECWVRFPGEDDIVYSDVCKRFI